jgi:hypothetical protein
MTLNRYNPKRDQSEQKIRGALHKAGVMTWPVSSPGLPDLLCRLSNQYFWIECKTPAGKLTDQQRAFFADARANNADAFVCRDETDVQMVLKWLVVPGTEFPQGQE